MSVYLALMYKLNRIKVKIISLKVRTNSHKLESLTLVKVYCDVIRDNNERDAFGMPKSHHYGDKTSYIVIILVLLT